MSCQLHQVIDKRRKTNLGSDWFTIGSDSYKYDYKDDGTAYRAKMRELERDVITAQHELKISKSELESNKKKKWKLENELRIIKEKIKIFKREVDVLDTTMSNLREGNNLVKLQ